MIMTEEEFRARVETMKREFEAHAQKMIGKSRRDNLGPPEKELFATPKLQPNLERSVRQKTSIDTGGDESTTEAPPLYKKTPTELRLNTNIRFIGATSEEAMVASEEPTSLSTDRSSSSSAMDISPVVDEAAKPIICNALASVEISKKWSITNTTASSSTTEATTRLPSNVTLHKDVTVPADSDPLQNSIPEWYSWAKQPQRSRASDRGARERLLELNQAVTRIQSIKTETAMKEAMSKLYGLIDTLRFTDVTPWGLKRAKLFEPGNSLAQIYDSRYAKGVEYPTYIVSDAKGLQKRWLARILDGSNMFRGIKNMVRTKENSRQGPSIDDQHKIDWHFHGEGHLVNSDWFANQLCAVRDGAHGSAQGGISGIPGKGATSISMSGDIYKDTDRDELDEVWYSGSAQTNISERDKTANTQLLFDSETSGMPVRVLRSMHLPKTNIYKPERGFRYDGLYTVKSHRLIDVAKHHYVFHLVRNSGQDPIRYKGIEKRPTAKEIETYDREMKMFGKKRS